MGLLRDWAARTQAKEARSFREKLSAEDSDEIGLVVACAANVRNQYRKQFGVDLNYPSQALHLDDLLPVKLARAIKESQKSGRYVDAASFMVWLHTLRAFNDHNIRNEVRGIWKQMERGFASAESQAENFYLLYGVELEIDGYQFFPDGLAPTPR